jgi:hypothetical protein
MPHTPAEPTAPAIALHDLTLGHDRHPAVHHLNARIALSILIELRTILTEFRTQMRVKNETK